MINTQCVLELLRYSGAAVADQVGSFFSAGSNTLLDMVMEDSPPWPIHAAGMFLWGKYRARFFFFRLWM